MKRLFILLAFFSILQNGFAQGNTDCIITRELSLAPEKWVDKDFLVRELINDTVCTKSIKIDTCIWKDISFPDFAIKKGFYQFKHVDSTSSISITMDKKMDGYNDLYKQVTGKKLKKTSELLPSDSVYKHIVINTLNQAYSENINTTSTEEFIGIYNPESILGFELRSKEDILIMRIDRYKASKSLEGTVWFKINSDGNFLMISLIKGVGKPSDIKERQKIEAEILSWFLLDDDFSSSLKTK